MVDYINLLHISDLNFNMEIKTKDAIRKNVLTEMLETLKKVDNDWKPNIVVISGDIGYHGDAEDYSVAKEWLSELLNVLIIPPNNLIVCPGNHDLTLKNIIPKYEISPKTKIKADDILKIEELSTLSNWFENFNNFCKDYLSPVSIDSEPNYLIGVKKVDDFDNLEFIIINSAWFSRKEEKVGTNINKLWIGLPFLEVLKSNNQIKEIDKRTDTIKITIMHHPKQYLNEAEYNSYGDIPSTYHLMANHSHLILIGHSHNEYPIHSERIDDKTLIFECGATYEGKNYKSNFSIFKIDTKNFRLHRKIYIYHSYKRKWEVCHETLHYPIYLSSDIKVDFNQQIENIKMLFDFRDILLDELNHKFKLGINEEQLITIAKSAYDEMLRRCGSFRYDLLLDLIKDFLKSLGFKKKLEINNKSEREMTTILNQIALHAVLIFQINSNKVRYW